MTFRAVFFVSVALVAFVVLGGRADAASRCNLRTVGDIESTVVRIEGDTKMGADQRGAAMNGELALLSQERQILAQACSEKDGAGVLGHVDVVAAKIDADSASYALESFRTRCADGAPAIAAGFVAAGWSALGQTQRTLLYAPAAEPGRDVVVRSLTALAADLKLQLPDARDATDFWVQGVQAKGRAAAEACGLKK